MEQTPANLYDYPKYYDLLFGSDWQAEYKFLLQCFDEYAKCPVQRVFEPACGTGRLLIKLAKAGYEVAGNDLNPKAVEFCNKRMKKAGFTPTVSIGDMADFTVKKKFHAAFNTINSFRHLSSEKAAESHLHCMGNALTKGGLYILGLHLTPTKGDRIEHEEWTARRGHLQVNSAMWCKNLDLKKRNEQLGMTFDIYTPTKQFRLIDEMNYRTYTDKQFKSLLSRCPEFEVAVIHDFVYDVKTTVEITAETEDVVFILRKK
ncbi:SAM-dependent methyltransferase [Planctomicrobium piriforme]|uniref:Methyltransferase domain-containing protein n=1 Tax=Planctomicrobium piriforme TaxID=1576369 RepID=A0A1I3HIQ9_9PLAN|nr:class I SAM-dependent methyltransferase [Planctomicrobium piriforme]SFI35624.1 Methyltransferase domain-containing protein [Planctomicrobium piriforme]